MSGGGHKHSIYDKSHREDRILPGLGSLYSNYSLSHQSVPPVYSVLRDALPNHSTQNGTGILLLAFVMT